MTADTIRFVAAHADLVVDLLIRATTKEPV